MKYYICRNSTCVEAKDPRAESPFEIREVTERELPSFEQYLIRNGLHAYGEGYAHYFKGRIGRA